MSRGAGRHGHPPSIRTRAEARVNRRARAPVPPDRERDRDRARSPLSEAPPPQPRAHAKSAAPADDSAPSSRPPRRGLLGWRRPNRRVQVTKGAPLATVGRALSAFGRRLLFLGKVCGALILLAGALGAGRWALRHVVASPRFAVRDVRLGPTEHARRGDLLARAGVSLGDRLLAIDTDRIAARLADDPWILAARVSRELPATLVIDVTERRAAAVAMMGALYLIDERGHPFKRATLAETDGLVVLTGLTHDEYVSLPKTSEAAFREALALYAAYNQPDSLAVARAGSRTVARPALSEVHIDPRTGYSLILYEGGGEIRLGRGDFPGKLARLDEILRGLGSPGPVALRVVHLDGKAGDRVPIRLADSGDDPANLTPPPKARN